MSIPKTLPSSLNKSGRSLWNSSRERDKHLEKVKLRAPIELPGAGPSNVDLDSKKISGNSEMFVLDFFFFKKLFCFSESYWNTH